MGRLCFASFFDSPGFMNRLRRPMAARLQRGTRTHGEDMRRFGGRGSAPPRGANAMRRFSGLGGQAEKPAHSACRRWRTRYGQGAQIFLLFSIFFRTASKMCVDSTPPRAIICLPKPLQIKKEE